ncbi:Pyridoxamine 5'-phosphate oxidase-like protein [Golovinomyces cichoracearum]|uniref:Pyridoxamine 5'-phosphate oxidase-like protein n=1 Tax=Golovinomyces cichoracearum TaxID=62708 RepID=A0A420IWC4_9PEZI|nr:Pyridoxamine 5'-phosphate oxidase-like protein [Golovinomyces cichoracearum]
MKDMSTLDPAAPKGQEKKNPMSNSLPPEVIQCLKNARFLHLATCTDLFPHVALMNYTYLPTSPYCKSPIIVMTTNPNSKKTHNLIKNPNVSLLVHDWVSHRPPTNNRRGTGPNSGCPPPEATGSSLASLLLNLNTSAMSSISATINGQARLVDKGTEEERYYREAHIDNHTFIEGDACGGSSFWQHERQDGGRGTYIERDEVRVVIVKITDVRISDWKGQVSDWTVAKEEELVNGN